MCGYVDDVDVDVDVWNLKQYVDAIESDRMSKSIEYRSKADHFLCVVWWLFPE